VNKTEKISQEMDLMCQNLWGLNSTEVSDFRLAAFYTDSLTAIVERGTRWGNYTGPRAKDTTYIPPKSAKILSRIGVLLLGGVRRNRKKGPVNLELLEKILNHPCVVNCYNPDP
jgi:hypothetical protein